MSTSAHAVNERLAEDHRGGHERSGSTRSSRTLITEGELQRLSTRTRCAASRRTRRSSRRRSSARRTTTRRWPRAPPRGESTEELYDKLAIEDVQLACDVMRPVWESTDHLDGYVSIEVNPTLARRGDETLAEARRLWKAVDRPNVMIKIPGTPEGVGPIEEAIADGININVTLLFGVEEYATVAEAFIRALERRQEAGESLDVHSVASLLRQPRRHRGRQAAGEARRAELQGKAGIANARAAYQRFKEIFGGERFAALRDAGRAGPAAAVGVDRHQEPEVPRHALRRQPRRARDGQHDADGDAAGGGGRSGEVRRPRLRRRPDAPTSRRSPTPASTWTTSPTSCCARASRRSRSRSTS